MFPVLDLAGAAVDRLPSFNLLCIAFVTWVCPVASDCHADDVIERAGATRIRTEANTATRQQSNVVSVEPSSATSFLVEVAIDPTEKPSGDHQAIAGLAIGLSGPDADAFPGKGRVCFELREGKTAGFWDVWIDGINEGRREPAPQPPGWVDNRQYQKPWEFKPHTGPYRLRIIGAPVETGTHLRFYFEHFDRPVFEFTVSRKVVPGHVGLYAVTGGTESRSNTATFQDLIVREVADLEQLINPSVRDIVLDALDLKHPALSEVAKAVEQDRRELAGRLLLEHLKSRTKPVGPGFKLEYHGNNYREVADAVLQDRYGTLGPFAKFDKTYIDGKGNRQPFVDEKDVIRWDLCNGHLTRHFHWVSLAKAYVETKDERYAARFSREVQDWVAREPFLHPRNPDIGGLNWMDGTTFELGYMNTSNIGRRCEMTWWPAYDEFRKSPSFTDDAHFHMLLGFLRQSRLIMNPSSFAAHDDGGAHICVALLQNALMLPEFKESKRWEQEAVRRWEEVLKVQFHEDGSHVSLSTGYNWASLMAMENMIALYRRVEREVPQKFLDVLELAYQHPIALSRPDQGQIDLNDSSWGMIDDHMRRAHLLFPERDDFLWMATKGEEGKPPEYHSIYFPNAGHIVMRTGWGPQHRYLFMDAGPVGASHGKEDKLNIYLDYGGHQLLASGGRGSYAGGPFAAYTGSTRAYNTVLVDGGVQARTYPRYEIDGHSPEQRRFVIDDYFEYAEGFHTHGWFAPGKHIQGKHTRQVLFVKGHNPPETSYWVVFDTMEPQDANPHEYEALFHIRRNHAKIADPKRKVVHGWDAAASLRILPVTVDGLDIELVHGQTEPHIQGWHVVGNARAPMWTPTFRWKTKGKTTRAWVLVPAGVDQKWCVDRIEVEQDDSDSLVFRCIRPDGSSDRIYRRSQNNPTSELKGTKLRGDLGAVSTNAAGKAVDTFFVVDDGDLKEHFGEQ